MRWRGAALIAACAAPLATGACALRSDVTRVRLQLEGQQREVARADSARAANLASIARLVQTLIDSLAAQQGALGRVRADLRLELLNVQQQLVQVQELTGQSQQRLTELRAQLDERSQQLAAIAVAPAAAPRDAPPLPGSAGDTAAPSAANRPAPLAGQPPPAGQQPPAGAAAPPEPTADQLMELSLQQLRRNSPSTARAGFAEFLRRFPQHPRAADAELFSGEAWAAEQNADSAAAAYQRVAQRYATSPRAATALYRLGLRALSAGKRDDARAVFQRLVAAYATSDEAALARERLRALTPSR